MSSNLQLLSAVAFIAITLVALKQQKKLCFPIIVIYLCGMFYMLFFIRLPYSDPRYALRPFRALVKIVAWNDNGLRIQKWAYRGILLNILLFVPFGYLLPQSTVRANSLWKIMVFGFSFSLVIESAQLITRLGMFDIDDLINNTIGAVLGWICFKRFL